MATIVTRAGKGSPLTHNEVDANFTNLNTAKAETASPALTGTPTSTTAAVGTNTTQIATTAFVNAEIANDITGKADLASPALTGTPTAPTAAVGTSTTQIATTAFVNAEIANDAPTKTGTGASGTWGISITGNAATVDNKSIGTLTAVGGIAYVTSTTVIAANAAGTAGQVLLSGGAGAPTWDEIPPVFSEWYVEFGNASTTKTIASGKQYVIVACGAGGGGAAYSTGSVNTNTKAIGGNGGSAVVASGTTSSAVTLTITVGAGGSGRTGGNQSGGDGGDTTISGTGISITAAGGKGGFTSGTTAVASTPNGASSGGTVYEPGYWNFAAGGGGNVSFSGTCPFGGGGTTPATTTSGMSSTNDSFNSRLLYQTMAAYNVMTNSTKNMIWPVFASNVISYTGTASFVDSIIGGVAGDASSDTNGGAGAYGGGGGGNSDSTGTSSGAGGSGWYIIWGQK
jgi:hypothetical protein